MEILKQIKKSLKTSINFPCSYIEGNSEKRIYIDLKNFSNKRTIISKLSKSGFRRSYDHMYIPQCSSCNLCISSRINLKKFKYTKSSLRNLKINSDLLLSFNTQNFKKERYELFIKYCSERHNKGQMQYMSNEEFENFFYKNNNDTTIIDLIDSKQNLFASILLDILDDGYSAVYSFFDPYSKKRGLGKNLILRSLELIKLKNKDNLYLGYWVKGSSTMDYKYSFKGLELFINGEWKSKL